MVLVNALLRKHTGKVRRISKAAEILGKKEQLPVYKFLKEPLIRKFGQAWYKALEECAEEWKKQREE